MARNLSKSKRSQSSYVNISYMHSLWENDAIYLDELIDMNICTYVYIDSIQAKRTSAIYLIIGEKSHASEIENSISRSFVLAYLNIFSKHSID